MKAVQVQEGLWSITGFDRNREDYFSGLDIYQRSRMRKFYIAGPMRGIPLYNFPAFDAAANELREQGHTAISPTDLDREHGFDPKNLPADTDWSKADGFDMNAAIHRDIKAIVECDSIYMLHGWRQSTGAKAEHALATWLGHHIEHQSGEPVTLEAHSIVNGARQQAYGHPREDFGRTARHWQAILDCDVTPEQVALCMIAVKMSRLHNTPNHRDSMVDIAGYAETLRMVQE